MQIPRKLSQLFPGLQLRIDHAYGREFPSAALRAGRYRLVIHCGGCMIDPQKVCIKEGDGDGMPPGWMATARILNHENSLTQARVYIPPIPPRSAPAWKTATTPPSQ